MSEQQEHLTAERTESKVFTQEDLMVPRYTFSINIHDNSKGIEYDEGFSTNSLATIVFQFDELIQKIRKDNSFIEQENTQ